MRRREWLGIEVLANPTRRQIVALLAEHPHRPSVLAAKLGLARSTISYHLAILWRAGIVRLLWVSIDDRSRLYALDQHSVRRVVAWLAGTGLGAGQVSDATVAAAGMDAARLFGAAYGASSISIEPDRTDPSLAMRAGSDAAAGGAAAGGAEAGGEARGEFSAGSQETLSNGALNARMAAQPAGSVAPSAHILVVDDEPAITDLLSTALRYMGYQVTTAATGMGALEAAASANPDLVVLDVMLPDIDGFEVCRRLRDQRDFVPVIFLSARDTEDDRVTGFVRGGDDYVTKPFSLEELTLRIGALLRRVRGAGDEAAARLRYRDLEMDEDRHQVWRAGREIELSPTEFRLLRYFLLNPERVLSKQQILDHVWQYDFNGEDNVVETYVSYLRRKVDDVEPKLLRTVRGFGYVLRAE